MLEETYKKGLSTELHCLQDMTELGYQCLIPLGDSCKYDVAVDLGNKIVRIQCKHAHWSINTAQPQVAFEINTHRQSVNTHTISRYLYTANDIDYFYTWFEGQGYLVPIQEAIGNTFRWRYEYPSSGQKQGIHIASDYKIEEVLKS